MIKNNAEVNAQDSLLKARNLNENDEVSEVNAQDLF